jgi:hypothetical protein
VDNYNTRLKKSEEPIQPFLVMAAQDAEKHLMLREAVKDMAVDCIFKPTAQRPW